MSTIKKIAELSGVSQSTVSRVLNNPNYHCSSPEKRDRIWKTAMELQYVPNEAAKNLKMGKKEKKEKTYYISILLTYIESLQSDPFFAELVHVIETEIHRNFCILSKIWYLPIFSNDRKCRGRDLDKTISGMTEDENIKTDGLIVIGKCSKGALDRLNTVFKNVVAVSCNPSGSEVDEVNCDGVKIAEQAIEYLISQGHRDIGYVGDCHNEAKYRGYVETLKKHDIDLVPSYVFETKQTESEGYDVMNKILKSDDIPTGIFCSNDITAIGVLKCLSKARNRYISVSVISSGDIEAAQFTTPMLSTIAIPKEEMGKYSLYLLLDRIKGGHKSKTIIEVNGKLVKRESCRNLQMIEYYI